MISGAFGRSGRLYVDCRVAIPRFRISAGIRFLVDTGSDETIIHPRDIEEAGVMVPFPENMPRVPGIGGSSALLKAGGTLLFTDADRVTQYPYRLAVNIARPGDHNRNFPSLLGRDVLDCWYLESDPTNRLLQFTVRRTL